MRVLVVGAAGFLGAATVEALVRAGHEVRGGVRTRDQFALVQTAGATPVRIDLLSGGGLREAVRGQEVVVHLAQSSGQGMDQFRRVRAEGGRRIAQESRAAGVRRVVVGSGYWVYADNPAPIDEESPLEPRSISAVNYETETTVARHAGPDGPEVVVARPGMVYGNGSWFAEMVHELREGSYRYVGGGANFLSPVERGDTGAAFACLVVDGRPGEAYLVVDDLPMTTRAFAEMVARELGAAAPGSLARETAIAEWGEDLALLNLASRRASNAKLRRLGWVPKVPDAQVGVPALLRTMASGTK